MPWPLSASLFPYSSRFRSRRRDRHRLGHRRSRTAFAIFDIHRVRTTRQVAKSGGHLAGLEEDSIRALLVASGLTVEIHDHRPSPITAIRIGVRSWAHYCLW